MTSYIARLAEAHCVFPGCRRGPLFLLLSVIPQEKVVQLRCICEMARQLVPYVPTSTRDELKSAENALQNLTAFVGCVC